MTANVTRRQLLALAIGSGLLKLAPSSPNSPAESEDQRWSWLLNNPWVFVVDDDGTIAEEGVGEPKTRADVFLIDVESIGSPARLIEQVSMCPPLEWIFRGECALFAQGVQEDLHGVLRKLNQRALEALVHAVEDEEDGWRAMIEIQGIDGLPQHKDLVSKWLAAPVDWDEQEWFSRNWSGVSRAYNFFQMLARSDQQCLGLTVVEGEMPGSDYFAARLETDVQQANRVALKMRLPIRFIEALEASELTAINLPVGAG